MATYQQRWCEMIFLFSYLVCPFKDNETNLNPYQLIGQRY